MTDEQTQNEGTAGTGDGNIQPTTPLIESATSTAERLERATSELKKENDRREQLIAQDRLSGRSVITQTDAKKEIDPKEYAREALRGRILQ